MRRGSWAEDMAALRREADDDVIRVRRLEQLGVPQRTSYRRCQQDGPWLWLLPGIIKLSSGPPTWRQMLVAALLHAGDDALITGLAGLRLHRQRRVEEPASIHLLVPWTHQVRSHGFAVIERTKRMPPRVERDGLPVAHLVRCLTDTVRRIKDHDRISALITDPVQRELLVVEQIHDELEAGCRRGTAAPRAVLGAARLGVRSPAEFGAFEFWNSHDFPEALWNVPLLAPGDRSLIAIPDALVKDVGFAWEQDSIQEHFATRAQVLATRRRRQRLFDRNVYVLSSRPNDLTDDPEGVRREIEKGLEIAAGMPEPDVLYGEPGRRSG